MGDEMESRRRSCVLAEYGYEHELLSASEVDERYGKLFSYTNEKWMGVFDPNSGVLLADNCLRMFQVGLHISNYYNLIGDARINFNYSAASYAVMSRY